MFRKLGTFRLGISPRPNRSEETAPAGYLFLRGQLTPGNYQILRGQVSPGVYINLVGKVA